MELAGERLRGLALLSVSGGLGLLKDDGENCMRTGGHGVHLSGSSCAAQGAFGEQTKFSELRRIKRACLAT